MERKNTYMINSTIQVYYHKLTHTISLWRRKIKNRS
jgi:hypothetical protein